MDSTYRKKDIREEIDLLRKEGGKVASSSAPVDKAVGRALAALVPAVATTQPVTMVVATTARGAGSGEPSIFEELGWHKKRQKGPDG